MQSAEVRGPAFASTAAADLAHLAFRAHLGLARVHAVRGVVDHLALLLLLALVEDALVTEVQADRLPDVLLPDAGRRRHGPQGALERVGCLRYTSCSHCPGLQ